MSAVVTGFWWNFAIAAVISAAASKERMTLFMASYLQFGMVMYLLAIGAEAVLCGVLLGKKIYTPFSAYVGFITGRSCVMFPLLWKFGNRGWYAFAYDVGHTISTCILLWVVIDLCWRWGKWIKFDYQIVAGIVIFQLFDDLILAQPAVPYYLLFAPTYSYIVAQGLWFLGIFRRDALLPLSA